MTIADKLSRSPRDEFAAEVVTRARREPGVTDVRYDREKFAVTAYVQGSSAPVWLLLSNLYAECDGAPAEQRRARIERHVRVMSAPRPELSWEDARRKLRPVLRPATFRQTGTDGQAGTESMMPLISRPALPFLDEHVVIDNPESMHYVTTSDLGQWGVTAAEVFDVARTKLGVIAKYFRPQVGDDPLMMIDEGDLYYTSLLLEPGWLRGIADNASRQVIAFVPDTRIVLLYAVPSAADAAAVYAMVEEKYRESARRLSPVGYVAGPEGTVIPYRPEPGDPAHIAARRAETVLAEHNR